MGVGKEAIIRLAQLNCKCNCQLELSLATEIVAQTGLPKYFQMARISSTQQGFIRGGLGLKRGEMKMMM